MTQQGRGGEAMGAQLTASAFGGIVGALVLALLIPVLKPIAMAFGSAEVFMLIVFGLTFIVVVSRESIPKGFTAALLGLLIGTVGLSPHTGVGRYTFDQLWLWDGFHIVCIVLGIFAFSEMLGLGARGRKARIAEGDVNMSWGQLFSGSIEVFRVWALSIRTAVIGTLIGIIPGLGGDSATWICYGHAVQTCKNNENFGKGDIRGVIAVETANNSKEGGALLTTLVFGIPGSSGMAILLGAFLILGIVPGPQMITERLDLVWGLVWVMILANILGAAILYPISGYMGRLAFLRGSLLIPPILVLAAVGAYLIRGLWQDVIVVVVFGFVGYAMKRWDYPRAPLILSFILGPLAETYLHKSISAWGGLFLLRPIVVVLMVLVVLSLAYSIWQTFKKKTEEKIESKNGEIIPAAILLILFTTAFFLSTQWTLKTRLFPQIIVIGGIIFSLWLVITEIRKGTYLGNAVGTPDPDFQTVSLRNEIIMTSWIILFLLMILVSGFWVAIALFTPLFMRLYGKESWKIVTTFTVCIWIGIFLVFGLIVKTPMFGGFLNLTWW
jgi:TctA family transporter